MILLPVTARALCIWGSCQSGPERSTAAVSPGAWAENGILNFATNRGSVDHTRIPMEEPTVKVVDAIARILKIEGAEFLSAYPTTPVIEEAAHADIRPVL